jgi:hypothetical protein
VLSARDIYLVKQLKVSPLLTNPTAHTVHLSTQSTLLCGTSCRRRLHFTVIIVTGIAAVYGSLLLRHILTFFKVFDKPWVSIYKGEDFLTGWVVAFSELLFLALHVDRVY